MKKEKQTLSCRGPNLRKLSLVLLLFSFCASIFFFQLYIQFGHGDAVISPSLPSVNPSVKRVSKQVNDHGVKAPPNTSSWKKISTYRVSSHYSNISYVPSPPARHPVPLPAQQPLDVGIPRKFSGRKIYTLREIADLFAEGHLSVRSTAPLWPSKTDKELILAKSEIEKAGDHQPPPQDDDGLLHGPLYHNLTRFSRSYDLMKTTLKVYIYKEGDKPIFHQPTLKGTYASEGWFMKILESNKHFITKDPNEAHLFYIPFGSLWLRTVVPNAPGRTTQITVLTNYIDMIAIKYPFWNRTRGADHFFAACQDWFESITRAAMPNSIRALCDADVYKKFVFGKDVSLPATFIPNADNPLPKELGGKPPSKRNILAFFTGRMTGYFRPILMKYWENVDPDIILLTGSPKVNGSEDYISYMQRSKFCLCPRGTISFSPRIIEAIYYGCVPVLISDNYIPPFSDVLNWESFTVYIAEKDVAKLKDKLLSISDETYLKLHSRVKMVRRHFLWNPQNPLNYDIFHMILHSVWYNRVFQFQANAII